jgi:hypothetical protein
MSPLLARLAVALVAVAAIGWLAAMERDARLLARGRAALEPPATRAALERAAAALGRERPLNPDTEPDVTRALVLQALGRNDAARNVLRGVVRDEPRNRVAWGGLLILSRGRDPATVRRATAQLRRLDPFSARRR